VADDLIAWVEETDIDGFNLSRIVTPESLEDFVDLVVPILQERGASWSTYQGREIGTARCNAGRRPAADRNRKRPARR